GQGHINRPAFSHDLPDAWVPALPDIRERLERGGRVADVGCGQGFATVGVARSFPHSTVVGLDADKASIADARRHAAEAGVAERAHLVTGDASELAAHGPFDLVLILETLHDLPQPVAALRAARRA